MRIVSKLHLAVSTSCLHSIFVHFIGMLSKAKGQVLRVAATLHVLFSDTVGEDGKIIVTEVAHTITPKAIVAARNFIDICCQHVAYTAGRGDIEDEIENIASAGTCACTCTFITYACTCTLITWTCTCT